jgi:hypothetical protein
LFTKIAVVFAFTAFLLFGGMKDHANAHLDKQLLGCYIFSAIPFTHAPKFLGTIDNEGGMIAELYDVNGDGRSDIALYSAMMDGEDENMIQRHQQKPIFYEVDEDGDEVPDFLFIDPKGEGKCSDLVLYSKEERGGLANWKQTRPDLLYDGRSLVSN